MMLSALESEEQNKEIDSKQKQEAINEFQTKVDQLEAEIQKKDKEMRKIQFDAKEELNQEKISN